MLLSPRHIIRTALILAALTFGVPAAAQDAIPLDGTLMQVKPGPRRYFHTEGQGCPARVQACRRKGYVVPGDQLVAGELRDGFVYVTYVAPGRSDPTEGWIESDGLIPVALPPATFSAWLGTWNAWDNHIEIKPGARPGALEVSGEALWGSRDPWRVEHGSVHDGEIDGTLSPRSDRMIFDQDEADREDCRVEMRLLGPYLIVGDNNLCGGVNVSFSGIYRR